MSATDGIMRGMEVVDTGAPLSVRVGGGTNFQRAWRTCLGPVDTRTTSPRSGPAFIFIQLDIIKIR